MTDSLAPLANEATFSARRALPALPKGDDLAALRKTAQEFEAVFLGQMLQPMFEGLSADGPLGGGHAEKVYRGLLVEEYGKMLARRGGIGIADAIMRTALAAQEIAR